MPIRPGSHFLIVCLVLIALTSRLRAQVENTDSAPGGVTVSRVQAVTRPGAPSRVEASSTGPDAVHNQLAHDSSDKQALLEHRPFQAWFDWKQGFAEATGLDLGADYHVLAFKASDSPGEDSAASGVFRLYGRWEILGRGAADTGSLVFKTENRDAYNGIPPADLGFDLGYVGLLNPVYSDQGARTTNLYWRQSFSHARVVSYAGFLDSTDYVDVYALGSPWSGFSNLVFSTGSASMGGTPDGALGLMVATWVSDSVYLVGGMVDANGDPADLFEGFDTFFNDFETFKSLDIHWTPEKTKVLLENAHLSFWQVDSRGDDGSNDGYGVSFSVSSVVKEKYLPFLRGGWASDGGSLLEASVSAGFGYKPTPDGHVLGVGLNWGRPNRDTFGADLDDQYTAELFCRLQIAHALQVTPSVQVLADPALNPEEDLVTVLGIHLRVFF
jgi:porin